MGRERDRTFARPFEGNQGSGRGEILGPDLETTENDTEISGSTSGRSGQGSGRGRRSGKGRGRAGVAGSGYISSWFYLLQCDQWPIVSAMSLIDLDRQHR